MSNGLRLSEASELPSSMTELPGFGSPSSPLDTDTLTPRDGPLSAEGEAKAAQDERTARLRETGPAAALPARPSASSPAPAPAAVVREKAAPKAKGWFGQSLNYWNEHDKAPSERGEALTAEAPGAALEVEEPEPAPAPAPAPTPEPAPGSLSAEPSRPAAANGGGAAVSAARTSPAPAAATVAAGAGGSSAVRRSVSSSSSVSTAGGRSGGGMGARRKRQLHVPESLLPHLNQLHTMFPKVSVTAIAEDLMKTNNNMQRTIENILNGLESEIPTVARRSAESVDETRQERRQLRDVQNRLLSQQNSLRAAVATSEEEKEKHREEARSYITQLRSFGCFGIVSRFRIRMLFRIHRSELKREVQQCAPHNPPPIPPLGCLAHG